MKAVVGGGYQRSTATTDTETRIATDANFKIARPRARRRRLDFATQPAHTTHYAKLVTMLVVYRSCLECKRDT